MKRITFAFWLIFGAMSAAWIVVETGVFSTTAFIPMRNLMVQYSGLLAIAAMSVAMILALRLKSLEPPLGGLDKMYRLHKWLGISALILGVTHWLWSNAPKWAATLGLLERGPRAPRAPPSNQIEQLFMSYRGTAEMVGEWTFYAVVLLIIVALVKLIPYRLFFKTHCLLAVSYLALVFHTVILAKFSYWLSPIGLLLVPLLLVGSYGAVVVLFRRIGAGRKATATIASIQYYSGVDALEIAVENVAGWLGHKPGQFAFVTSDTAEGAHPYTIASAWNEQDCRISFIVKELGDHTSRLREKLFNGQEVVIEGPYGRFLFEDNKPIQIWIGGGIGITPFVARMNYLASVDPSLRQSQVIHLFHATAQTDVEAMAHLDADAKAAGVRLYIYVDSRDVFLTGERIRGAVPAWRDASFWFCGPSGLGRALRRDLSNAGVAVKQEFNQELFEMR